MTDDVQKSQGQNPGQSGQQQQKNPQDVSKKDPSQDRDRVKERDNKQGQQDQGGQRRAS
jgi:hypothetical protein